MKQTHIVRGEVQRLRRLVLVGEFLRLKAGLVIWAEDEPILDDAGWIRAGQDSSVVQAEAI